MLTTPEAPERHYWPEFLPNGQAVLFTIGSSANVTGATSQIAILDLETREQRVLIEGGTHPRYASGHLIYSFDDTLRAVRFDLDRLEVLSDPIPVLEGLTTASTGGTNVDLSDDGALVYQKGGWEATHARLSGSTVRETKRRCLPRRAPTTPCSSPPTGGQSSPRCRTQITSTS